jgi:hypothetical protein
MPPHPDNRLEHDISSPLGGIFISRYVTNLYPTRRYREVTRSRGEVPLRCGIEQLRWAGPDDSDGPGPQKEPGTNRGPAVTAARGRSETLGGEGGIDSGTRPVTPEAVTPEGSATRGTGGRIRSRIPNPTTASVPILPRDPGPYIRAAKRGARNQAEESPIQYQLTHQDRAITAPPATRPHRGRAES